MSQDTDTWLFLGVTEKDSAEKSDSQKNLTTCDFNACSIPLLKKKKKKTERMKKH